MSFFGQAALFLCGTSGRTGAVNAQWLLYSAPSAIHRRSNSFSAPVSSFFDFAGGIRSSGSLEKIRRTNSRSEEHTSELQSHSDLVCRLLLEKKKIKI